MDLPRKARADRLCRLGNASRFYDGKEVIGLIEVHELVARDHIFEVEDAQQGVAAEARDIGRVIATTETDIAINLRPGLQPEEIISIVEPDRGTIRAT